MSNPEATISDPEHSSDDERDGREVERDEREVSRDEREVSRDESRDAREASYDRREVSRDARDTGRDVRERWRDDRTLLTKREQNQSLEDQNVQIALLVDRAVERDKQIERMFVELRGLKSAMDKMNELLNRWRGAMALVIILGGMVGSVLAVWDHFRK